MPLDSRTQMRIAETMRFAATRYRAIAAVAQSYRGELLAHERALVVVYPMANGCVLTDFEGWGLVKYEPDWCLAGAVDVAQVNALGPIAGPNPRTGRATNPDDGSIIAHNFASAALAPLAGEIALVGIRDRVISWCSFSLEGA